MSTRQLLEELRGDIPTSIFAKQIGITPRMLYHIYRGTRHIGEKTIRGLIKNYPNRSDELMCLFLSQNGNNSTQEGTN